MIKRLTASILMLAIAAAAHAQSLRFFGSGTGDADRVKIRADSSSIPANIGAGDITIEFWMKSASGNNAPAVSAGGGYDWIWGNIIFDRDRYSQPRGHGISLTDGRITFGVNLQSGQQTWRGTTDLRVGSVWHHIAVQRAIATGAVQIYVDGVRQVNAASGPTGSLEYPTDATPGNFCPPPNPCTNSDPYIVIGAEKHDYEPPPGGQDAPSFSGWITELRLSRALRYTGASFAVPQSPFTPDADTAALYHFDHGTAGTNCATNTVIVDSMDGASDGFCRFGGLGGPQWSADSPFTPNSGALQFSSTTYSAAENAGTAAITVSRTGGTLGAASVSVAVNGGTATHGADYNLPANTTLSWADGEGGAKSLNISIIDDPSPESNETIVLALANANGATTGSPAQATLTLSDNDGGAGQVLQFSSAAATVNESAGVVQLTVARTGSPSGTVTVAYATSNGTAASGSDYVAANGTLSFGDGETTKTITVTISNDTAVEADETFTVTLSSPTGATLGANAAATVTIVNDDTAPTPQPQPPPSSGGGGGGGGSLGALVIALGLLLTARGRRERARA